MLFPWWIKYPNSNNEILNLDWLEYTVKHLSEEVKNFINLNTIKYADPILWNITSQYEANTVVIDPQTGNAYISVKPVPLGVILSNTDYWTEIFNYEQTISVLRQQIAITDEGTSTTATGTRYVGQLVWLNGILHRVTSAMIAGDMYVEGSNCQALTIENLLGNLFDLNTTDKTNLVAAINESLTTLFATTGALADLNTLDKTNLVAAINESLTTLFATTGALADLDTIDKTNLVAALNETLTTLFATTGALADLNTADKTNLVAAINENRTLMTKRRYIFVGDSYGVTPSAADNCVVNFRSYYGLSNEDCINASQGGIGFTLASPYTYLEALQAVENAVNTKETITDIVIFGGYNDIDRGSMPDVTTAARAFVAYANTIYPNAKISFIYAGVYRDTQPIATRQNIIDLKESYLSNIATGGIETKESIDECLFPFTMVNSTDHVHPTTAGAQKLARAIYQSLNGAYSNDSYVATLSITNSAGSIVNNESPLLIFKKHNTMMQLNFVSTFDTAVPFTSGDNTSIKIGEYTSDLLSIYSVYSKWVVLPASVILNFEGVYYTCSGELRLASGNVYLDNVNIVNSNGWVSGNLKSVIVRVSAQIPNEII